MVARYMPPAVCVCAAVGPDAREAIFYIDVVPVLCLTWFKVMEKMSASRFAPAALRAQNTHTGDARTAPNDLSNAQESPWSSSAGRHRATLSNPT